MNDQALYVELGLDPTKVKKGIGELKNILKQLDKQRALTTSNADLEILNKKIAIVNNEISKIKDIGLQKFAQSSKQARTAATNLSLVIQDLPYGFIGIQNNIPGLIQSFTQLQNGGKGLFDALKSLGSQLIGPSGLFLAFSAGTAIITTLVQKYGSFSDAVKVLTSRNKDLTESQLLYNKELQKSTSEAASENAILSILVKRISDTKKPLSDRKDAYFELNKLYPDVVRNIKEENALTAANIEIIKNNAEARKEYIKFKARESSIQAVINANTAKSIPLEKETLNIADDLRLTIERKNKLLNQDGILSDQQLRTLEVLMNKEAMLTSDYKKKAKQLNNLIKINDDYIKDLDYAIENIARYDRKTRDLNDGLEDQNKETRNLSYSVRDLRNAFGYEEQIKSAEELSGILLDQKQTIENGIPGVKKYAYTLEERKKALSELQKLAPEYFKGLNAEKSSYQKLDDAAFTYIRTLQELRDQRQANINATELQAQADKNRENADKKVNDALEDQFEALVKVSMANDGMSAQVRNINSINLEAVKSYKELMDQVWILADYYKRLDAQHIKTGKFIEQYLKNPLEELFDVVLSKGKNKWKDFGDAVVKQLKRIAAQELATAAASLIANIISPGSGAAVKRGLKGISTNVLGEYLTNTGGIDFGKVQGVSSLSGQVVFVQRGSDLVGVLNRTNATINRVG